MADAGVAARRVCEQMIEEGRVTVNGEFVTRLPVFVDPGQDTIEVDGRPLPTPERHVYVMLNKPKRSITTNRDEPGAFRRTVLEMVDHPAKSRLYPVGRLDFETVGLLLLTNDGELANKLTHPRYGLEKTYRVTVKGSLEEPEIEKLEEGIYLAERKEGRTVGAVRAAHVGLRLIRRDRDRTILELTLKEGRNRQVRRMLAAVGCPVRKLERVAIGPLKLKGLARGEWRELTRPEIIELRKSVRAAAKTAKKNANALTQEPGAGQGLDPGAQRGPRGAERS